MDSNNIDYEGLRAHIIETLRAAFDEGTRTTGAVGSAWGEVAFKAVITARAMKQTFVPPETYARIAATVFREAVASED